MNRATPLLLTVTFALSVSDALPDEARIEQSLPKALIITPNPSVGYGSFNPNVARIKIEKALSVCETR